MNKILSLICVLCGLSQLRAAEGDVSTRYGLNKTEGRAAAFVPASDTFREIYGDLLLSLQIEQARVWETHPNLEVWGNLEWIFANGNGTPSCGTTRLDILNVSIGAKAIGAVYRDWIYLYVGLGPDLGITWIQNSVDCCRSCHESQSSSNCKVGIGGIAKSGCQVFLSPHFYLDFFADYLYLPMHFQNTQDIGGVKAGVGLSGRY